jgi:hypothetical protein
MPNHHRGEVEAVLGGTRYTLCLTLGALAELEAALGASDLTALGERFAQGRVSARDLMAILAAGLKGGGAPLTDAEIAALPLAGGIEPYVQAVADLMEATFGTDEGEGAAVNPPRVQAEGRT